jgi:hypothetical protein
MQGSFRLESDKQFGQGLSASSSSEIQKHAWTWTANGAVILRRECSISGTALSPSEQRVAASLNPAARCELQGALPEFPTHDDVSFSAGGIGETTSETYSITHTVYMLVRAKDSDPSDPPQRRDCAPTFVQLGLARPSKVPEYLASIDRSVALGGLVLAISQGSPGYDEGLAAGQSGGGGCPELGPDEVWVGGSMGAGVPTSPVTGGALLPGVPLDLYPRLRFPRSNINFGHNFSLGDTVGSATFGPDGELHQELKVTLSFTLCPRRGGRSPEGC